jgi:hypothetical protein
LLIRLLLNPGTKVYLRELERDLGVSSNTVRLELNKLSGMKLIVADEQNSKIKKYQANISHPLFQSLRGIILKYVGLDYLLEEVIYKLGDIHKVYLTGNLAEGKDSSFIDLVMVGGEVDKQFMDTLITKAEKLISKKIRVALYKADEFEEGLLEGISHACIFSRE